MTDKQHEKVPLFPLFEVEFERMGRHRGQIRALYFTHRQADPDALCSAAGLLRLIETCFGAEFPTSSSIVVPRGASVLSIAVCDLLGIVFVESIDPSEILQADLIVVVDTGEPELLDPYLGAIRESKATKMIVDHHTSHENHREAWDGFDHVIIDSKSTSTCEIVTNGFPQSALTTETARILLTGLMFDSQHLGLATASTLEAALALVRAGVVIEEVKNILRTRPDRSETIARIKSAQRLQSIEIGKYFILKTEVSSFQASVARMLLDIGADLGIAYGLNEDEVRVSVRSTQRFYKETALDLGRELYKVATSVQGMTGGGHATAASLSGKGNADSIVAAIVNTLKDRLQ